MKRLEKKRLAVIGANAAITMLIDKAKEKGYETHVFAWQCGDPGEKAADVFYPISIADKEKILEICKTLHICGVVSVTSDFAVNTVNYVARNLGLVGNSERTDLTARNKYEMRRAFQAAGLYTPRFCQAGSDFQTHDVDGFQYPLIVKPTDRWSSKGVTRVDSPNELSEAVRRAVQESFNDKAIIEEFMEGPEYSAECICYRGECRVLTFTRKETTGNPHYIETGHVQPAGIPEKMQESIRGVILKALEALDIQNGAAHAEFRIMPDGQIGIIEIGARMGGDSIGTDLTSISTGMDYLGMVVDIACGQKPCFDLVTDPTPVRVKFIICESDKEIYERLCRDHPESIVRAGDFNDDFDKAVVDSSTRHGYYIEKMV